MVRCTLPSINSAIIFMSHEIEVTNSNFSSSFLYVDMLKKKKKKLWRKKTHPGVVEPFAGGD
jgi:hypothetical protein